MRLQIAAGLTAVILLASAAGVLVRPHPWSLGALLLAVVAVPTIWALATATGARPIDTAEAAHLVAPLVFGVLVLSYPALLPQRLIYALAFSTVGFAAGWVAMYGGTFTSGLSRFEPFTGGSDGAHASAYMLSLAAIILHIGIGKARIGRRVGWAGIGLAAILLLGLRVTTPLAMLLVYALVYVYQRTDFSLSRKSALVFAACVAIVVALFVHEITQEDITGEGFSIDQAGSGRISAWRFRLDLLAERQPAALLLGSGPGTDSFVTPVWWWDAKNSHNDLLTTMVESGLLGGVALVGVLVLLGKRAGRPAYPLIAFFLVGSVLSNGLLYRPFLGFVFWLAVAVLVAKGPAEQLGPHRVRHR